MKRQRLMVLGLGIASLAAVTNTAEAQRVVAEASVVLPPVEARVIVGDGPRVLASSYHHRVGRIYQPRRRPGLPRHVAEALYRIEQQYHEDLRRAERLFDKRLRRAERRYRQQMHRAHRPGRQRQVRREFLEARHWARIEYQRDLDEAERRFLRRRAEILNRRW